MKLKQGISFENFLQSVNQCHGAVTLRTAQQDRIDLKSDVSALVMAVLTETPDLLHSAFVECEDPRDYERLAAYLE